MDTKKLKRTENEKMIAGVCGGLGEYLGIDPTIVRLIFVLLVLTGSLGLWLYLIMWIVVPSEGGRAVTKPISPQTDAPPDNTSQADTPAVVLTDEQADAAD
jgi:phage shock protein C